ncbi:MAG: hypothetical protein IKL46_04725, partial [Clostridia bacterium]|nr:hypothetical protein [Clostridia bacterium]
MAKANDISNITQKYYRYELWEDYKSGMYNSPPLSEDRIQKAIECLSDEKICREYMQRVVTEWQIATEQVLTNPESNGRAW